MFRFDILILHNNQYLLQIMLLGSLVVLALVSGLECMPAVGYQAEDGASVCEQLTQYWSTLSTPFLRELQCHEQCNWPDTELPFALEAILACKDKTRYDLDECLQERVSYI